MEQLAVTFIQTTLSWEEPAINRQHFTEKINALTAPTDLIILPEMFTTGFSMNSKALAEPEQGPTLAWLQKMAQQQEAAISGSVITKARDRYFNRLYMVFPDGSYQCYDKRHLFSFAGEDRAYAAGQEKLLVNYKGWKICPLICYDLRFPVWARNTADYDFLFYIANWPDKRTAQWDALLQARSIENQCYTLGLNRIGSDGNSHHYDGHSAVYNALGERVSAANWEGELTETVVLEKAHLTNTRTTFPFLNDRDAFEMV